MKVYNAIFCRLWKDRPSARNMGPCRPTIFCSSPRGRSPWPNHRISFPSCRADFPIRVELAPLTKEDSVSRLNREGALVRQYHALMATEGLTVEFTEDGLAEIAATAVQVNERTEKHRRPASVYDHGAAARTGLVRRVVELPQKTVVGCRVGVQVGNGC